MTNAADSMHHDMFRAAAEGDWAQVHTLLDAGADLHARNEDRDSLLHLAADWGEVELTRRLIAMGAEIDARDEFEETPLMRAAHARSEACMRLLLEAGADPNAQDNCTEAPLHHACEDDLRPLVRLLLDYGASPHLPGMQEQTPLHRAVSAEVAEMLLAAGADTEAEDVDAQTPLHHATIEVTHVLIAHGANIHARDCADFTPLFCAHSAEKIRLLREAGAQLTEKDMWNAALLENHREGELADWLERRGSSLAELPDTPDIRDALESGRKLPDPMATMYDDVDEEMKALMLARQAEWEAIR